MTCQGVPLTSYMEGIIVNTVSSNSGKGRAAIEWVVEKLGNECRYGGRVLDRSVRNDLSSGASFVGV